MHDAHDIVEVLAASDRGTGVSRLSHCGASLAHCHIAPQKEHRASRYKDLAQHALLELEGTADDLTLLRI